MTRTSPKKNTYATAAEGPCDERDLYTLRWVGILLQPASPRGRIPLVVFSNKVSGVHCAHLIAMIVGAFLIVGAPWEISGKSCSGSYFFFLTRIEHGEMWKRGNATRRRNLMPMLMISCCAFRMPCARAVRPPCAGTPAPEARRQRRGSARQVLMLRPKEMKAWACMGLAGGHRCPSACATASPRCLSLTAVLVAATSACPATPRTVNSGTPPTPRPVRPARWPSPLPRPPC